MTNYFGISNRDDEGLPDDVLCEGGSKYDIPY
jgi:hypothetical protein